MVNLEVEYERSTKFMWYGTLAWLAVSGVMVVCAFALPVLDSTIDGTSVLLLKIWAVVLWIMGLGAYLAVRPKVKIYKEWIALRDSLIKS